MELRAQKSKKTVGYLVSWHINKFGLCWVEFWKCIVDWYWFVLVLRNVCKKGNVGFSKELLSKISQNPRYCFCYRLSYIHPNEVIPIDKEQ